MGQVVHVLAEEIKDGYYEGLTDEYVRVSIRDSHIERGHLYPVKIDTITDTGMTGTVIKED